MHYQLEECVTESGENPFRAWLKSLDKPVFARIQIRLMRVQAGNLGDVKFFDGIGELRFSYAGGIRVYFAKHGDSIILLLTGGDKSSQTKDIRLAKQYFDDYKRSR